MGKLCDPKLMPFQGSYLELKISDYPPTYSSNPEKPKEELFYNINSNPLIRTDEIYPGADGRLQEIVDKATQKNPDKRYQNCEEMLEKIESLLVMS